MSSRTALIVDEQRASVQVLQAALAEHGFPSEVAYDHDYALNIIKCFDHAVLFSEYGLLDHCVPQMHPKHFLRQVRALKPGLLIVLMCKSCAIEAARNEEGVITVLEKPLKPDEVQRTIEHCAHCIAEIPQEVPRP